MPIVQFLLGVAGLEGGFVRVDVSFVISGFLIAGMTIRDFAADNFSTFQFYRRRLRCTISAVVAVVGTTLLAGLMLLLSHDFLALSRVMWPLLFAISLASAVLSIAWSHSAPQAGFYLLPARE